MIFPFAALVGQEQLKLALVLNGIDPGIGGVLIRGEKGTAKSTAARALAGLLPSLRCAAGCPFRCDPALPWPGCPHCGEDRLIAEIAVPFVDLPLGATEDRVLGSLDFERALKEGRRAFQPGLLASAHRGVLYIDEVNLLADHLVDVLLDAAALGVNTVERDGMTVAHPSRFVLVGTMNPEEGDLRPQLLDRFGLTVVVAGPRDPELRAEILRRRFAYETDATVFLATWAAEQSALRDRVQTARERLPRVVLDDGLLLFITRLCCELEVDGLRGDLVLHRTSRAHAAYDGRDRVTLDDVRTAAELVLPHRRRRKPFEQPELEPHRLDDLFDKLAEPNREEMSAPGAPAQDGRAPECQTFEPAVVGKPRPLEVLALGTEPHAGRGRRNAAGVQDQGRFIRAVRDPHPADIALNATLSAAAARGGYRDGKLTIEPGDLHARQRAGKTGTLILFVVDASGSMAARQRMAAVKGAVLGLLQSAYEERDQVAVIAFRGSAAELLISPTTSVELAERALRDLPTGGRTPLAQALVLSQDVLQGSRRTHPEMLHLLVVLSDGKANVPLPDLPGDPWAQALQAARALAQTGLAALVLDTEVGFVRLGQAQQLGAALAAEVLALEGLSAEALTLTVRDRVRQTARR